MLENRPGALPTPLSQRRWASSFNLDFLSDYSFRTRRNVAYLAAALSDRQGLEKDPNAFMEKLDKKLCEYEDMFHGIGYESGSFADAEHVPTPGRSSSAAPNNRSHLMIASSYFYPEQPALLPLLAHEFAHYQLHHIAESVSQPNSIDWHFEQAITDAVNKIGGSAGEPLLALPYSKDVQYIHDIVVMVYHELKADFIAFSLHGSAYVHALLLNLLGSEGASRYTVNRSRHNAAIYREVFAQSPKEGSTNAPSHPSEIGNTLRLYFCTQLLKATESDEAHGFQHVVAFRESVERLTKSYLSGMQSLTENDSKHEHWNYFFKLVSWLQPSVSELAASLWEEFGAIAKAAASFGQGNCVSEPTLQSSLEQMVSDYCKGTIVGLLTSKEPGKGHDITEIEFKLSASKADAAPQLVCVETAPLAVRWHFALLYQQLLPLEDSQPVFFERVCGPLVNYLRNDGSVISRYLMEYIVARKHCIQKLAAEIRKDEVPLSPEAKAVRAQCLNMMQSEPGLLTRTTYLSGVNRTIDLTRASAQQESNVVADFVGSVLAEEQVPWRHIHGEFVPIRGSTTQFAEKTRELCKALGKLCDTTHGAPVGMLELGAMMFFSGSSEPDSAYLKLYKQLHDQTSKQQMQLNKKVRLNQEGSQPFALATVDLLGDYSYATFMRGTTPAERDMVIGKPLPIVSKARFVVQVHGRADWGAYDKTEYPVRAITLIRLPYRHLWTELVTALPAHIQCNAFLSTGWETLVLDWRVKASCEFWNFTEYFLGKRGDSHTMMAGDASGGGVKVENNQDFKNVCDNDTNNCRTGRYDYGGNVASATVPEMFQKLASLSNDTWKFTHKISMEAKLDLHVTTCSDQSFSWMLRQMKSFC